VVKLAAPPYLSNGRIANAGQGFSGQGFRNAGSAAFLAEIIADHGPVLFHQSGGCCDGSSPMCYPQSDFIVGDLDVLLGEIGDTPVYISGSQYEAWKHTDLIIDVVPGRGGMFSSTMAASDDS